MDVFAHMFFWLAGTLIFLIAVGSIFLNAARAMDRRNDNKHSAGSLEKARKEPFIQDLPWTYVSEALIRRGPSYDDRMHTDESIRLKQINKFL